MTESAKPESPPADQGTTAVVEERAIPSTTGSGTLLSEVASMRETLSDRIEQLSVENARLMQLVKESQRSDQRLAEENKVIREALDFLKDRQSTADQQLGEAKQVGQVVGELIKAGLPVPSLVRIAESYRAGQDLHAVIQAERDYLKKVLRVSEQGDLSRPEPSGLGLTESAGSHVEYNSAISSDDLSEMDAVLSGKFC